MKFAMSNLALFNLNGKYIYALFGDTEVINVFDEATEEWSTLNETVVETRRYMGKTSVSFTMLRCRSEDPGHLAPCHWGNWGECEVNSGVRERARICSEDCECEVNSGVRERSRICSE